MPKKIKSFSSFQSAEDSNIEYYRAMSPEERLEMIQILREQWIKLNHKEEEYRESRARLRTVCRIVKLS